MRISALRKLCIDELRELYSAENQIDSAFPDFVQAASSAELRNALKQRHQQAKDHIDRLKGIFISIKEKPEGHLCRGVEGLIKEAIDYINRTGDPEIIDAVLIASLQKITHCEIASYGIAGIYSELLGDFHVYDLLQKNLEEAKEYDVRLAVLAENEINIEAGN